LKLFITRRRVTAAFAMVHQRGVITGKIAAASPLVFDFLISEIALLPIVLVHGLEGVPMHPQQNV